MNAIIMLKLKLDKMVIKLRMKFEPETCLQQAEEH